MIRLLVVGLLALGALQDGVAPDAQSADRAFIEVVADQDSYYVQQRIRLTLRLGFDAAFLRTNGIELFAQRLDLPLQVEADWLQELPGTILLPDDGARSAGEQRMSLALGDGRGLATRVADRAVGGRQFTVLEIRRTCLPTRAGQLVVPAPRLRFAYATRFEDDFVHGRVPVDRHDAVVEGRPLTLRIEPLPDAGRPPGFTNAVGRFAATAGASPRELAVGESLLLVMRIRGEGNLMFFDPPRLDDLDGFHCNGMIESRSEAERILTYDLVPLRAALTAVPPIPLPFFDPAADAGYRVFRTDPIAVTVRPLPRGATLRLLPRNGTGLGIPGVDDLFDLKPVAVGSGGGAARSPGAGLLVVALLLPWALALGLSSWLRRRARLLADPEGARARGAAAAFAFQVAGPGAELAAAVVEYLAARLRCPQGAVIGPELASRLAGAGVPAALAARTAGLLEGLVAARYGSAAPAAGVDGASALVEDLEAVFAAQEGR